MQRRITGILCVWIGGLALALAVSSSQWVVSEKASGGLEGMKPCVDQVCETASYNRFDTIAPWLNPIMNTLTPNEGERLFVLLGRFTSYATSTTVVLLLVTGLLALVGFGIQGPVSAPRLSLLMVAVCLVLSLAFISSVPSGNVLGRLFLNAKPGLAYALQVFGVLMGAFGAALIWQPIRSRSEALPNRRIPVGPIPTA